MSCNRSETEIRDDLAALTRSMSRGISTYSYDGRSVTYRSWEEMQAAKAAMEAELAEVTGDETETRQQRHFAVTSRGLQ